MVKESTREKYKKDTGLEPLTKAGTQTSAYKEYLLDPKNCTVPWMANWSSIHDKNIETPYKTKTGLLADLEKVDKENRLKESCVIGGKGRGERLKAVAGFRREAIKKYGIENY